MQVVRGSKSGVTVVSQLEYLCYPVATRIRKMLSGRLDIATVTRMVSIELVESRDKGCMKTDSVKKVIGSGIPDAIERPCQWKKRPLPKWY